MAQNKKKNNKKFKAVVKNEENKRFLWFALLAVILLAVLIFFLIRSNLFVNAAKRYIDKEKIEVTDKMIIDALDIEEKGYNTGLKKDCLEESYVEVTVDKKDKITYNANTICSDTKPVIKLIGKKIVEMYINQEYVDLGANATISNKDITDRIKVDTKNLDESKAGSYEVVYSITDRNGNKAVVSRKVNVIDNLAPVITLKGKDKMTIYLNQRFVEPGYNALDNNIIDLTGDVEVSGYVNTERLGYYYITYKVSDYAGNTTTKTREVKVIKVPDATITLKSGSPYLHTVYTNYTDPGYTAFDVIKGDITKDVKVTGNVDNNTLGDYILTYEVTGTNNKTITIKRTVKVVDNIAPVITLNGNEKETLILNSDTYTELGATAFDNYDKDITNNIIITGVVDDTTEGTYYIYYTVTDTNGNSTTMIREVEVIFKEYQEDVDINLLMITNEINEGSITTKKSSYEGTNVYYKYIILNPSSILVEHKVNGSWVSIGFTYNATDNWYEYIYNPGIVVTKGDVDELRFTPSTDGENAFIRIVCDSLTDDVIATAEAIFEAFTPQVPAPLKIPLTTFTPLEIDNNYIDNNNKEIIEEIIKEQNNDQKLKCLEEEIIEPKE